MKLSKKNELLAVSCGAQWVPRDGHYVLTASELQHLIETSKNIGWMDRDLETKERK